MNDNHSPADFERLEQPLETAVQAALAGPIPEDAVGRVKARARQLAAANLPSAALRPPVLSSPAVSQPKRGWRMSRAFMAGLAAAAALLAMMVAGHLLLNQPGRAFAQMLEKVKAVHSVRFTTAMQLGRAPEINGQMFLEGNRLRQEQLDGRLIVIGDIDQKRALFLDVPGKIAQSDKIDAALALGIGDPIEQLRKARAGDAEPMGEEMLRGRRTRVYRLRRVDLLGIKGPAEAMVWIDVESELPAKIVIRDPDPKTLMEFRFDDFAWNEPLDAGLFSLSMPEGFHAGLVMLTPHAVKPPEPSGVSPESSTYLVDGILSRDRVPARIVWGAQGKTITALMQDPESVPALERRPNELRQWDVATGKLRWSEPIQGASCLAATADGKHLATVIGYEVQIRDAVSGKITHKWTTEEHLSPLAFSPDGKSLAAGITEWGKSGGKGGKESGGVQIWDIERASLLKTISDDKPVTFVRYSADGKYLATSSNAGPEKMWDVGTGELARIFPGHGTADFSSDCKTIACQVPATLPDLAIGRVDQYRLRDGVRVQSFASEKGLSASYLLCIKFSPDGRLLAASDWNGTVTLWDVASGARKLTVADNKAGVLAVAFAPDGATLATGSEDRTLRLHKLPAELIPTERVEKK